MTGSRRILAVLSHCVLTVASVLTLAPILWAIRISFFPAEELFSREFHLFPSRWIGFENYWRALSATPLLHYLGNGAVVCMAIIVCQLAIAIPCAYGLAKFDFRGRGLIFGMVIIGLVVPPAALVLPLFVMAAEAGLIDTYASLVLPWTISALGIFLLRQAFRQVPDEVIEAARLDGLAEIEILVRVLVPMITPAIGALVMLSLVAHWNDLLWPSIAITSGAKATPPFGVMLFQVQELGSDNGPLMAGAILIAAPLLLAFLLTQRRFFDGLTWTDSK
ncbi:MAG: carbohydrate ABC transporter permease [Bradyrhizobium sp.]|uniref:carbohydrate ABC transporter permease n=1 Tax=Bradyrhizobium sp. TaxID=376 RepID=UPI0029AC6518|nr:carbohydrate ABC transporter permease [Bradyrhizobium sp.]MDX3970181.1 carbohydrate ABC transporter permease [Bradyrhizobium sp.]